MDNQYKIHKKLIPTCNIMGVNIATINMNWLLDFTKKYLKDLSSDYVCVANVHTTVTAYEDAKYREVQNSAVLAIPDGGPLSSVGRIRRHKHMQRTTGPSYMEEIFKISVHNGWKHYFYGSTQDTLDKLKNELDKKYPDLEIVGMYSPPFRNISKEEDETIIKKINETHPDFVWVGLGAPKQEYWMNAHKGKVEGLMVGVGAGFDYFAGNIKRAPEWMQKSNLEWFYRLIQDPKRLFSRYLKTNTKFIWHAVIKGE